MDWHERALYPGMDWQERARCDGMPTDVFYPTPGDHLGLEAARAICAECPVAVACLYDALVRDEEHGVRAGTTPNQRRRMLRRAIKAA